MLAAGVSFVGYILAGMIQSAVIVLPICIALMLVILLVIRSSQAKKA
jgi:hypothetical protein